MMIAIAYSGMMTTKPAMIRVDTRYEIDLMPITSSASISSLIRMAPSSAVAPAPTVAASAWPATTGAAMRTLISAAKNPVNASTPILPSEAKPWMATSERTGQRDEADDRDGAADDRHRAGAHADLGDQPQRLLAVVAQRVPDRADGGDDEPGDVPDAVEEPRRGGDDIGRAGERPREPGPQDLRLSTRQLPVPNRTPMVVSTTLTANSATTHSTRVSLTAVPTPLAPPATVSPR